MKHTHIKVGHVPSFQHYEFVKSKDFIKIQDDVYAEETLKSNAINEGITYLILPNMDLGYIHVWFLGMHCTFLKTFRWAVGLHAN